MKLWPLQDAEIQLSQVIHLDQRRGPQTITRHGEPGAVIVSAADFKRMSRPKESLIEFLCALEAVRPQSGAAPLPAGPALLH